jgi:SAM-dependent methyltransferase
LGGDEWHDSAVASRYDDELWELVPEHPGRAPAHLREFVGSLGEVERALDLGCGDGRLTSELGARRLVAADVSEVALERARRRLGPDAELVELEPDAPLTLEDSQFDLVLCAETLEHVRDVQLLLSEARRVLRPGGTLAVTTPAHGRLTALRLLVRGFDNGFDPLSPHLRFFTKRSLRRVLEELGFDVRSLERERGTLLATARR